MATRIFVDGSAGTTGLQLLDRLHSRKDIQLYTLSESDRKDSEKRREALNACDIAFLCLPDDAAREAVAMVENPDVTVIDASTAHRTDPAWTYGFPELSADQAEKIASSKRIAVPGCHAGGFVALVAPLVQEDLLPADALLTCFSLTGYSGGGKKMIADYQSEGRETLLDAPRQYGLAQTHKHLPEMQTICKLANKPVFCPIVADFYSGMEVTVPLFASQLAPGATAESVKACYGKRYTGPFVRYKQEASEDGFLSANALQKLDSMEITVQGNEERILLVARFDNLGKGASGAAVACMNLVMGVDPTCGLTL